MRYLLPLFVLTAVVTAGPKKTHPDEIRGVASTAKRNDFTPDQIVKGGRAVLPLLDDIDTFNPYLSTSASAYDVHSLLYIHPLTEVADYHKGPPSFKPRLVDKWSVDGAKVTMHIRDDAVWSDGKPITAHDMRYSWQAAWSPKVAWANSNNLDKVKDVEVIDDKTFVFHFTKAYPYMVKDIKETRIIPKHVFGKIAFQDWKSFKDWDKVASVVSGPYRVQSYRHNEEFVLVPNGKYFDPSLPRVEKVFYRVLTSKHTIFQSVISGGLDAQPNMDAPNIKKVLKHKDLFLYSHQSLIYDYVGWNCNHWLFKDPKVRIALSHAIDVENMMESLLYGQAERMGSPFPSSLWACDRSLEPREFEPDIAEEMLADAGFKEGEDGWLHKRGKRFEFILSTNAGNNRREAVVQMIQADLKEVGIKVNIQLNDFNAQGEFLRQNKQDAWVGGWWLSSKADLKNLFNSKAIYNFGRWKNEDADRLIDAARSEMDRDKAIKYWSDAQKIMRDDPPYTLLYSIRAIHAIHKKFQNVEINANENYYNLHEWFIPSEKQGATR